MQSEVIARADWAFDYHLPTIDFTIDSIVSRAAKDSIHREHRKTQTFRMGQGDVVVRVYDKAAEIAQRSGKSWFHDLWGQKDEVWRVEFQVRGGRLKAGGIDSVDSLKQYQYDLLRQLARNHTTIRHRTDDKNRSRWPYHRLWKRLIADIESMPQTGLVEDVSPANNLRWRRQNQLRSLYGSLKGLGAVQSLTCLSVTLRLGRHMFLVRS